MLGEKENDLRYKKNPFCICGRGHIIDVENGWMNNGRLE